MPRPIRTLARRLEKELWKHPGKWVALSKSPRASAYDRLVAIGDSPKEVFDIAQKVGVEVPLLWKVPDGRGWYIFQGATL